MALLLWSSLGIKTDDHSCNNIKCSSVKKSSLLKRVTSQLRENKMTSICVKIREDSYYFEIKPFNAEIISFQMKLLFDFKFQLKPKPWYRFT